MTNRPPMPIESLDEVPEILSPTVNRGILEE